MELLNGRHFVGHARLVYYVEGVTVYPVEVSNGAEGDIGGRTHEGHLHLPKYPLLVAIGVQAHEEALTCSGFGGRPV